MTTNFNIISGTSSLHSIVRPGRASVLHEVCLDPLSLPFDSVIDTATNQWKNPKPTDRKLYSVGLHKLHLWLIQMKKEIWFLGNWHFSGIWGFYHCCLWRIYITLLFRQDYHCKQLVFIPLCWIQMVSIERNSGNKFTYYSHRTKRSNKVTMSLRFDSNLSNSFSWILMLLSSFISPETKIIVTISHFDFLILQNSWSLNLVLPQSAITGFLLSLHILPWEHIQFWSFKYHLHTHAPEFISLLHSSPQTLGSFMQCPLDISMWIPNDDLQINIAKILLINCTLKPALISFSHISF